MKNRIPESLIFAFAIIVFGGILHNGFLQFVNRDRIVSVRGLAETEAPADKVFWSVSFSEIGDDISKLSQSIVQKDSLILKFFTDHGIAREELTVNAPEIIDVFANPYMEKRQKDSRYTMTSTISLASSNIDAVRKLRSEIAEVASKGIALNVGYALYEFTKLNEIKPQMIEEATRNARAAAEKFAKDSQSKLGKIKLASQGLFSIDSRDESTPYIKKVRVVTNIDFQLED